MKHLYKTLLLAVFMLTAVAHNVQAQSKFVINYNDDEGVPQTKEVNTLNVVKDGINFLINSLIDISKINYIAPFFSEDTNEGKVTLPEDSELKAEDITVVGDTEETKVDDNGNFQTTANNLVAMNPEGQVVYRTIVSMEEGEQMRQADLNAKETAISLIMPMFSSISQGMSDEALAKMKSLIGDLPEIEKMAKAIDASIAQMNYLSLAYISEEFNTAVSKVAELSGLDGTAVQAARRAAGLRAAATTDIAAVKKSLVKAEVKVTDNLQILRNQYTVQGYKGVFDVTNKSRLGYSGVMTGRKMLDGRVLPVDNLWKAILPPVRMNQFVNSKTTWADIKRFITSGSSKSSSSYDESCVSDVELEFGNSNDVLLVAGPKDNQFMMVYNIARTTMSVVVPDLVNILKNGGAKVQDQFYLEFVNFIWYQQIEETNSYYIQYFQDVMNNEDLTLSEKLLKIFEVNYTLLDIFIKQGGESVESKEVKALLTQMNTPAAEKVLQNKNFYRRLAEAYGDNTMGSLGFEEDCSSIDVEGLDIQKPIATSEEIYSFMDKVYNIFIEKGNEDFFYKGRMLVGSHPTLDTQATGWDADFCRQRVSASTENGLSYDAVYQIIGAVNEFEEEVLATGNEGQFKTLIAEARALRAFCYMYLAQTWGKVPLRGTGETLINIVQKEYPADEEEVWAYIIDNLSGAADVLDWQPREGINGRPTKGMVLSYLGEAYLWRAYIARQKGKDDIPFVNKAREALGQVIDSGIYHLEPCYSNLWDGDVVWSEECVWQFVNEMNPTTNGWSRQPKDWNFYHFYAACPANGGWGSEHLSWELYFLFEDGDKRRDASLCTLPVSALSDKYRAAYGYGRNIFLQENIVNYGKEGFFYSYGGMEYAPGIWSTKIWRLVKANWNTSYAPVHIYFKRYSGVMLDYAECLFRLGIDESKAWKLVDEVRNRAFGNIEVAYQNIPDYCTNYYNKYSTTLGISSLDAYPIPYNTETTTFTDAKTYYEEMTNNGLTVNATGTSEQLCKPFKGKAEPWQVALGQERRKEFNSEFTLKADLQRSDFMSAHMECNYPTGVGSAQPSATEWHTYRDWQFDPQKLTMPIPATEIQRNPYAKQNPGN